MALTPKQREQKNARRRATLAQRRAAVAEQLRKIEATMRWPDDAPASPFSPRGFGSASPSAEWDESQSPSSSSGWEPSASPSAEYEPDEVERFMQLTPKKATADTWITKLGAAIKVTDMGDGHLVNTIKLLERNGERNHVTYPALIAEWKRRVDALQGAPRESDPDALINLAAEMTEKPEPPSSSKGSAAAKKAWETRRKKKPVVFEPYIRPKREIDLED